MIRQLDFPEGIHYFFSEERKQTDVLTANELALASKFGDKRLSAFCTGRYCMRKTLEPLAAHIGDILIGAGGGPVLPVGIAGTISHSNTMAGALAASKKKYLSLGLDIETNGRVKKDMWYLLFLKQEIAFLESLPDVQQRTVATIFFSAKEAFYKLQHPITATYLDFPEVEMVLLNGRFYVKLLRYVSAEFQEGRMVPINIFRKKDQVITYCALPMSLATSNTLYSFGG